MVLQVLTLLVSGRVVVDDEVASKSEEVQHISEKPYSLAHGELLSEESQQVLVDHRKPGHCTGGVLACNVLHTSESTSRLGRTCPLHHLEVLPVLALHVTGTQIVFIGSAMFQHQP